MKRLAILLLMLAVLSAGAAYGNTRTFFKSVEGVWKENYGFTTLTTRATILRDGTLYSYSTGVIDGKTSIIKRWNRPNGTFRGESYLGGKKMDEGTGEWRIVSDRLITSIRYIGQGGVRSILRRVNKDKFVVTITVKGKTTEAVLTRIRKK